MKCFHWEAPFGCSQEEIGVARAGFEPATFHFSGERCYQLSYLAKSSGDPRDGSTTAFATPTGLEPATSAVTGRRANQLRYGALPAQAHPLGARETIAQVWDGHEPTLFGGPRCDRWARYSRCGRVPIV